MTGSNGLESGRNYMVGCSDNTLDLAVARTIRIRGSKDLQFRLDVFNALNTVVYTGRVTQLQLNSPTDPTVRNAQYNAGRDVEPGPAPAAECRLRRRDWCGRRCAASSCSCGSSSERRSETRVRPWSDPGLTRQEAR